MMKRSILSLGLVVSASMLPRSLEGVELRIGDSVSASRILAWQELADGAWHSWEEAYGKVQGGHVFVDLLGPARIGGLAGRTRGNRIELNGALGAGRVERTLRHELAHHYLWSACRVPGLDRFPAVSEAFAQWASGDYAQRSMETQEFLQSRAARDHLQRRGLTGSMHDRRSQEALARLLAVSSAKESWDAYFRRLIAACRESRLVPEDAARELLGHVVAPGPRPKKGPVDFLLVEGYSQRALAVEGEPDRAYPPGSVLKPILVATVPALVTARHARGNAQWNCPLPSTGKLWTWQEALAKSCNGFFLDGAPEAAAAWKTYDEWLVIAGIEGRPGSMSQRIGLAPGFDVTPRQALRLFQLTGRLAPFVIDALHDTARDGTLSGAPAASWFTTHGVGLKTGTVRTLDGEPEHAWIAAVGPRDEHGEPEFFAMIHGTGLSTQALLSELRDRLQLRLRYPLRPIVVQVLGLVPPVTVGLSCDGRAPLVVRGASGGWRWLERGTRLEPGRLRSGETYECLGGALRLEFPDRAGKPLARSYWGSLRVTSSAPAARLAGAGGLPPTPRQARARAGSLLALTTTEREYLVGAVLAEFPNGNMEALKALTLVIKNNLRAPRHAGPGPGRSVCDTTHCNLFGPGEEVSGAPRRKVENVVDSLARVELRGPAPDAAWLPFHLGGESRWELRRKDEAIELRLGLHDKVRQILKDPQLGSDRMTMLGDAGSRTSMTCESFRNQLGLHSCPSEVVRGTGEWVFRGAGEGHGEGLPLERANTMAGQGDGYRKILGHFFKTYTILGE